MHSIQSFSSLTRDNALPDGKSPMISNGPGGAFGDLLSTLASGTQLDAGLAVDAELAENEASSGENDAALSASAASDDLSAINLTVPLPLLPALVAAAPLSATGTILPNIGTAALPGGNNLPPEQKMVNAPVQAAPDRAAQDVAARLSGLGTLTASDAAQLLVLQPLATPTAAAADGEAAPVFSLPAKNAAQPLTDDAQPKPVLAAASQTSSDEAADFAGEGGDHSRPEGKPAKAAPPTRPSATSAKEADPAANALRPAAVTVQATTPAQPAAPTAIIADVTAPADRPNLALATAPKVDAPIDLQSMVDRLSEARLMGRASRSAIDLAHPDFGRVTLQFSAAGNDRLAIDLPGAPTELRQAVAQGLAQASAQSPNRTDSAQPDLRDPHMGARQGQGSSQGSGHGSAQANSQERSANHNSRSHDQHTSSSGNQPTSRSQTRRGTFA